MNRPISEQDHDSCFHGPRVKGARRNGTFVAHHIRFPDELFHKIEAEAKRREWSFAHMVRHLCEAAIDGVE